MAINRQKISQMTPKGSNLDPTDLMEVSVQTGSGYETRSITGQEIINAAGGSTGTVTSVDLTMPSAFNVTGNPVTTSGTLAVTGAGTISQYIDGTGSLQTMPTGLPPTGTAGGDLNGSYPNPTVDGIHGIDMQSGTPTSGDVWVYGGSPAKWQHQMLHASQVDNDSAVTGTHVDDALNTLNTNKVNISRTISTTSPLNGGGDLTADRTLSIADAAADGSTKGAATFTASDFNSTAGVISIDYTNGQSASGSNKGFLTSTDWTTFNNKVSTGAITGSGLTLATNRLLGRTTAGSGAVEEISIGTGLTLSGGTLSSTGGGITVGTTAITSGTVGRILFEGTGNILQEDSALFWDNTNKRLGIGTSTPSTNLDIQGTTTTDSGQLGAELLSTTGWTTTGWTGDFTAGFTHTTGNTSVLSNTLAAVVNTYYQIAYTITGRTAGSVSIAFGGQSIAITATGTFGPRATTTGNLTITPTTDFDGTIIISIKVISTYDATVTLKNSTGTVVNEIRNHSINSNTFIGRTAGNRNTTGINNSLFGQFAGQNNTTGTGNSFFGASAGASNTTASFNSFFGISAGTNNTTGINNSFFGSSAGLANTTGTLNSFFGASAGASNTTGTGNSSFGQNAGVNQTTGISNIFVGRDSGRYISTGTNLTIANNSIFLGFDTRPNADSQTNQIVIGHQAIGLGSNTTVVGNSSTTLFRPYGNVAIGADTAGARLDVRAQGALSTDIAFRVRNSIDTGNHITVYGNDNVSIGRNGSASAVLFVRSANSSAHDVFNLQNGLYGDPLFRVRDNATGSQASTCSFFMNGRIYGGNTTTKGTEFDLGGFGIGASYGDNGNNAVWLNNQGNVGDGSGSSVISVSSNFYINKQTTKVYKFESTSGNFGIAQMTFGTSATNTIAIANGTAPTTSPSDAYQQYSADITAGNAAPHFRTENGAIVKVYQETTAVGASTLVSNAGTNITDTDTFDGYTLKQIVKALRNQGLLA